jgi:hypothetical protein
MNTPLFTYYTILTITILMVDHDKSIKFFDLELNELPMRQTSIILLMNWIRLNKTSHADKKKR